MSRIWIIDGRAFNSLHWRKFVHESIKDMSTFFRDLNATLNDDGTVTVHGLRQTADGGYEREDMHPRADYESHPLYETNRGALVTQTFSPDGFDEEVLATFALPEDARYARFDSLYSLAVRGHGGSLYESWAMIPDSAKLVYTLHLWERLQKRKVAPEVWAAALHLSWPHGKVGSMLFRANLSEKEVVQMFLRAPVEVLMAPEDLAIFEALPKELTVWRGTSSTSKHKKRGFSWTTSRDQAEWFALVNSAEGTPVILEGKFRRRAVLMCSTFEDEVVVNPLEQAISVTEHAVGTENRNERIAEFAEILRSKSSLEPEEVK